jgi:excisionase family DNA binding protein
MAYESNSELLTAEEVARLLRLKAATIYEAAAEGRIPCVRLWRGRRKAVVRFRRDEIEAFIQQSSVQRVELERKK